METPSLPVKAYQGTQLRILELLGAGLAPELVASAAGVSSSYISQLLSEEEFSAQVTALRFNSLQEHTARDKKYDKIEDLLVDKMEALIPMMFKSHEVLKAIQIINGAKRRGAGTPDQVTINNTVINLALPKHLISAFKTDINNQVVEASVGDTKQSLVTMPSASLLNKLKHDTPTKLTLLPQESAERAAA